MTQLPLLLQLEKVHYRTKITQLTYDIWYQVLDQVSTNIEPRGDRRDDAISLLVLKPLKKVWLQPYKAPCKIESGSYAITTVQSPNAFLDFFQEFSKTKTV